jgi:TetR/AcrR family transcriptional repressor of nem operon
MVRPRTFDEEEVLEGAVEAFRENGYDGISVPDLIERLGICRQSLYNAFGDKRGLYLKALERWGEREVDAKLALLEGPGSPLENVRTVLRGFADLASRCPSEGCFTASAIVEARGDAEALAVVESQVGRLGTGFRRALERAGRAGELKPGIRPERLAHTLVTFAYGIGILSRLPSSGRRIGDSVSVLLGMIDAAAE